MSKHYVDLDLIIDHLEDEWGYEGMREELYELPKADVRENTHGSWYIDEGCAFCSNCRNSFKRQIMKHCNYCPMCGADMRGELK